MRSYERMTFPAACLTAALLAGLLTWLCVGWLGQQSFLTAMIAVILVELFLASFGVIAILLTERMTVTFLDLEKRPASPHKPVSKTPPLWLRIASTVPEAQPADPIHEPTEWASTVLFPAADIAPNDDHRQPRRHVA